MKEIKMGLQNNKEVTFSELYNQFITRKKVLNLSSETVKYYGYCYKYFNEYLGEDILTKYITDVHYYGYVTFLKERKVGDITINTYLRGLRAFLYFGMKEGYVKDFKVRLVKAQKKIKETYTDSELDILLKKPNVKTCTFAEYRDWAVVNYVMGTGNRVSSIVSLKIEDIDFDGGAIMVRQTKNRRQQIIPLSKTLSGVLNEYLQYRNGNSEDYLFCDQYGKQITKGSLGHSIVHYNRKRGIGKTSIHVFRHTFAKKWILNGGDIFRLQKMLGHSSMDIVREYVNMFSDDLQINFDSFNPLDRISQEKHNKGNKIRMVKGR